ncbi:MAG: acyl-CoA dehydrogenase family protein [Planctomycetota bacterium]|nr:acyl-CoA dehydrogenase family protein [Planctomycetota bacterium]
MIRFEEHHQEIRQMMADFSDNEIAPKAEHLDESQELPTDVISELAQLGMLGLTIEEKFGGAELDLLTACLVVEEISRCCGSTGVVVASHLFEGTAAIHYLADEEGRERWLPALASGETVATFALAEVEAESDTSGITCSAGQEPDGFSLHGRKRWVVGGMMANLVTVVARNGDEQLQDLGGFVVDPSTEGCTREPVRDVLGLRGSGFCDLQLDGVRIESQAALTGAIGWPAISRVVEMSRLGAAAVVLGVARGAISHALQYASQRKAFGRSIDRFGSVRAMLAEAATGIESARLLLWRAAGLYDRGKSATREASMANLAAKQASYRATRDAVQVLGGNGYSREYPVERAYREVQTAVPFGGGEDLQKIIVARSLMGVRS